MIVCALSHEASGLEIAPMRGRAGVPLSGAQKHMCSFLGTLVTSVIRLSSEEPGCGLRLPATSDRLSQLREQLKQVESIPYATERRSFQLRDGSFTATQALPVVADRLSLPERVRDFNPLPFLSPVFQRIYEDPEKFLKSPEEMPDPIRIRGTASRSELLKVFSRWDTLGRLCVCRDSEVSVEDRCELFAVAKDEGRDRQILHRKKRNLRERHIVGASRDLPHGVLLCQLPLEDRFVLVSSVDDVRDCYHAYSVSEARAKSSPVGPFLRPSEVAHLKAYHTAVAEGRVRAGDRVACCFRGLGMGDHAAVDIAQESHVNLLRAYGAMREDETLKYRKPVPNPTSRFYEGVMIDDHLGLQLLARKRTRQETLAQPGRDQEVFAAARRAYESNNLEAHAKKEVRRGLHVKVWGAEIEGWRGLVGPTRSRLFALSRLSGEMARAGPVDTPTLEAVMGLWGFCAQFRRPLFSFMYDVFHQQSPGTIEESFLLSKGARNELAVLACLSPLCLNDLRAVPDSGLYCVDASPSGAGVCRAEVGVEVSREVWRRGDKQGYRMPMLSQTSAALKGSGWDEEVVQDWFSDSSGPEEESGEPAAEFEAFAEGCLRREDTDGRRPLIPPSLGEGPFDFLEVYSGCGLMTKCWALQGFRVLPPLELKEGWDLRSRDLFWGILGLIRGGRVRFLWWAPPCTTYSLARSPKLRSLSCPWGFDLLDVSTAVGNLHAAQSLLLALAQALVGNAYAGEQPAFGFMRALDPWLFLKALGGFEVLFDWCQYGRPFRKTTRLLVNFKVLEKLGRRCRHKSRHQRLEGAAATQAGAYSLDFCRQVALLRWEVWRDFRNQVCGMKEEVAFREGASGLCEAKVERERRVLKGRRKRSSALWAVQLSEGLCWKTIMQYRFKMVQHINLQEAKARRSLCKRLPRDRRVVICQDSRVNLGALGKGRSPSRALNAILRSEAPYLLGKNLYPSGLHLPTWSIRADAPSRSTQVQGPRAPLPPWFWKLRRGCPSAGDDLDALQGLPRPFNRWFVLVGAALLLADSGSSATPAADGSRKTPVAEGPGHGRDPPTTTEAAGRLRCLVATADSGLHGGSAGSAAHRCFVRVARGVYDLLVSSGSQPKSCGRDAQRVDSKLWMAEILACRALESDSYLGACNPSSAGSHPRSSCSCHYCAGLELASHCGDVGTWLFWLIETLRVYQFAATGSVAASRPHGRRRAVHPNQASQDQAQGSRVPTRAGGRARSPDLDPSASGQYAHVAQALERFLAGLQASIRSSAGGALEQ